MDTFSIMSSVTLMPNRLPIKSPSKLAGRANKIADKGGASGLNWTIRYVITPTNSALTPPIVLVFFHQIPAIVGIKSPAQSTPIDAE